MFFFFNDTATTEIYTLSLHDALPISRTPAAERRAACPAPPWTPSRGAGSQTCPATPRRRRPDRKSTRLNSSHANISYAVFCLKKKKNITALIILALTSSSLTHRHAIL